MSMFKTLQNTPGIITIFHDVQSSSSKSLLAKLQKSSKPYVELKSSEKQGFVDRMINGKSDDESKTPGAKYTIEEIQSGFPTYDQLKLIRSFVHSHPSSKSTFSQVFPNFLKSTPQDSTVSKPNGSGSLNIGDIKIPTAEETRELASLPQEELLNQDWFRPPLIIDWDNQLIANNETSLQRILNHYAAENHTNGD